MVMSHRRKWWQVLRRQTLIMFVALATGFFVSRWVFSEGPAAPADEQTSSATGATTPATPPSIPDYFDAHAIDTNGDGKVDEKDTPKWPDATGATAGAWTNPAYSVDANGKSTGGELPSSLSTTDLYDRISHNLFSINF